MDQSSSQDYFYPHGPMGIFTADNAVLCLLLPGLSGVGLCVAYPANARMIIVGLACLAFMLVVSRVNRKPIRILSLTNDQMIYTPTELGFACRDVILPFSSIEKIEIGYDQYKNGPKRYYLTIKTKTSKTHTIHQEFFHNPTDFAKAKTFLGGKCKLEENKFRH